MPKHKLPPNPERMNRERARWAEIALRHFAAETNQNYNLELDDIICDFIADLAHFCDRHNVELVDQLHRGLRHYVEETNRKGKQLRAYQEVPNG